MPEIFKVNRCIDQVAIHLANVSKTPNTNDVIPGMCCAYQYMISCLIKQTNKYCLEETGPETARYLANVSYIFFNDIIELSCGLRNSIEVCNQSETKWMNVFEQ